MGDPEWSRADWCQTEAGRMEHAEEAAPHVQAWAAGLTRDEIYHRTQAEGSPSGPIRNVAEVLAWDQARARGFFAELDHPEAGRQVYPTAAYQLSKQGGVLVKIILHKIPHFSIAHGKRIIIMDDGQ